LKIGGKIKLFEKCDICGKKSFLGEYLTCKICKKEICSNHDTEQYKKYSGGSGSSNYNYPDGRSIKKKKDFSCYQCRTGKTPNDTSKPTPFYKTKSGIVTSLIAIVIIFFAARYAYGHFSRDIYLEVEGHSGVLTTEEFTVSENAELKLTQYSPFSDNPDLTIHIYDSNTDELKGEAELKRRTASRSRRYYLAGDTDITPGEYYLTIDNEGSFYIIQIEEKVL